MLQTIMTALGFKTTYSSDGGDGLTSRRAHPRRTCDQVVGFVNGRAHPVLDWSPGGVRVFADSRPVAIGDEIDVEMKFHLRDELVSLKHTGKVVRKTSESVSLQFLPVTNDIRRIFQHVIDDFNAREFAGSQV